MKPLYREVQVGYVMIALLGISILGVAYLGYIFGFNFIFIIIILVLAVFFALYSHMVTEVTQYELIIRMGSIYEKKFPLAQITSFTNNIEPLYYQWGIRALPDGWIYSVNGFLSITITTRDGSRYIIGSKHPQQLLEAIASVHKNKVSIKQPA